MGKTSYLFRRNNVFYVRDSGVVHALLGMPDKETLLGHPICGQSWEGFVIENCLSVAPSHSDGRFLPNQCRRLMRFSHYVSRSENLGDRYKAQSDIKPEANFAVYPGQETYPMNETVQAISLINLMKLIEREK